MNELTIVNNEQKFTIKNEEILYLELKLNLSEYGKKWSDIGDYLFYFYHKEKNLNNILFVNDEQFKLLKNLSVKSLDEMR